MSKLTYRHSHGRNLYGPLTFSPHPNARRVCKLLKEGKYQRGGFTIRVDHDVKSMVIGLCSWEDIYVRELGRNNTEAKAVASYPAPYSVMVPRAQGDTRKLLNVAVVDALQMWQQLGWPLAGFSINVYVGASREPEEYVAHHRV